MLLDYGGLRPTGRGSAGERTGAGGGDTPAGAEAGLLVDMDPHEARLLLGSVRVARLATVRPDGAPHLVPICFALDGDTLVTAIDAKPKRPGTLARLRNIAWEPRVAVLADGWDEDWTRLWWVRLDGEAAIAESRRARSQLCDRYQQYQRQPPEGPVIVVRAVRWSGWRASAG